jgi:RNA polymerase-associated protein RTF1
MNRDKQTFTYRVCQVKKVVPSAKPYTFLNRTVQESLLVAHGNSEKVFEMGICSDKPITEEEFNWWKSIMKKKNSVLPSTRAVERKLNRLVDMQRRTLTSEEIDLIIKRRQTLSSGALGANTVIEKSVLQQKRQVALEAGDFAAVDEIDNQIASLDRILNRTSKRAEIDRLAKVNERNRRANMDDIRKAEVVAQEARRKAELAKDTSNPFARLRTSAKIFYESRTDSPTQIQVEAAAAAAAAEDEKASVESIRGKVKTGKLSAVDDVIAGLDIGLEIEL